MSQQPTLFPLIEQGFTLLRANSRGKGGRPVVSTYRGPDGGLHRLCPVCRLLKPIDEYGPRKMDKFGRQSYCRACVRVDAMARHRRKMYGLRKYGLNKETWAGRVEAQGGRCMICRTVPKSVLQVDHDHKTGKTRDLLCGNCNKILGLCHDDPAILLSAIEYLRLHNGVDVESGQVA